MNFAVDQIGTTKLYYADLDYTKIIDTSSLSVFIDKIDNRLSDVEQHFVASKEDIVQLINIILYRFGGTNDNHKILLNNIDESQISAFLSSFNVCTQPDLSTYINNSLSCCEHILESNKLEIMKHVASDIKYQFYVVSDIHLDKVDDYHAINDFSRFLQLVTNNNQKHVVICCCGDINTNDVTDAEKGYNAFESIMKEYSKTVTFWTCKGNHDADLFKNNSEEIKRSWFEIFKNEENFVQTINNDVFIFLSIESWEQEQSPDFDEHYGSSVEWLNTNIEANLDKRVFLFMHFPLRAYHEDETHTSGLIPEFYKDKSYGFKNESVESRKIQEIIEKHKNIIVFTGHTHNAFECQNTLSHIIYNRLNDVSYIHVPSLSYPRDENGKVIEQNENQPIQFFEILVYDDKIEINGMDIKESYNEVAHRFKDYRYIIYSK